MKVQDVVEIRRKIEAVKAKMAEHRDEIKALLGELEDLDDSHDRALQALDDASTILSELV